MDSLLALSQLGYSRPLVAEALKQASFRALIFLLASQIKICTWRFKLSRIMWGCCRP